MRPTGARCLAVMFLLANACGAPADDRPGWLNVQDCGASGSSFETTAATTAGSRQITVADPGDFRVGQEVILSKCCPHYAGATLFGKGVRKPLGDAVQMRGYDGTSGSWTVFVLDVIPGAPAAFRWSDDLGLNWHDAAPITFDWQPLSGGTQVRFQRGDWEAGRVVAFSARDELASTIEKIEGKVFTLKDEATRSVPDAVVRHCDQAALQAAVDCALRERRNVFVPPGRYRLVKGLMVEKPEGITIEGAGSELAVLDLSQGEGKCIYVSEGTEATIRNLRMEGNAGFAQRRQMGSMRTLGAPAGTVWGMYLKRSMAVQVWGTERVLVENCHARRMSVEAFYSSSPSRRGREEPKRYTKAITYLRCSVEDCARNAFNDNDTSENVSVLYCRIVDVGGCAWEGASRFVRFIGNYVRNAGQVSAAAYGGRGEHLEQLGSGQHIVADNVFEKGISYGRFAVRVCFGATQVVVRNNLFINYGTPAIQFWGAADARALPAANGIISGNIFDMTDLGDKPMARTAIDVNASDVTVSDNQIYVRGACDPQVTAVKLSEPAVNLNVHDNLIRNCGTGIVTGRGEAAVGQMIDARTFLAAGEGAPLERRQSHRYRGWSLAWLDGGKAGAASVIEAFDPETLHFTLREPRDMKAGDRFEIYPPSANWNIHRNTITGCLKPVVLDSHGSPTSLFRDNLVSRGDAPNAPEAIEVRGSFHLLNNHSSGVKGVNP